MGGIQIISASAGSGKTHKLATILEEEIRTKRVRPEAVVATTFTNRAAAELQERVRTHLLQSGLTREAQLLMAARFGTVNSVCGRLLSEFAFELGLSPTMRIMDENRAARVLKRALADVASPEEQDRIAEISQRWEHLRKQRQSDRSWPDYLQEMVDLARANGIDPEAVNGFGPWSFEEFSKFLDSPSSDSGETNHNLQSALQEFLKGVEVAGDKTVATRKLVDTATRMLRLISRGQHPAWSDWLRLGHDEPGAKSRKTTEKLREHARAYLSHPLLRSDFQRIIELLFSLASRGLAAYQRAKREGGLIDFTDQEVSAYELLNSPTVRRRLEGQIDLVLVDEFQDTSPLQLAIFIKLAQLAPRSIWVGDQKQAIYGFRGTDPALMDASIGTILGDEEPETLSFSYRSRPGLVQLTSDVFAQTFKSQDMPEERVRLEPYLKKEPAGLGPVVERWIIKSNNKDNAAASVAAGVMRLIEAEDTRVRDRASSTARPARPADIAVLCRTNEECDLVAGAIESQGIRAARPRSGLLNTHEGRLLSAGLRLWVDPKDRLACAEVLRLIRHPTRPDEWLKDALGKTTSRNLEDEKEFTDLLKAREKNPVAGALTAFDLVAEALSARERCLEWGDATVRLANLDAMREHAVRYLGEGTAVPGAAGPAGLLAYLDGLQSDELDSQAAVADENSVVVSTWHSAKGLEWPIVVVHGIEKRRRAEPFGVAIMPAQDGFDFKEPLAGRWIRYWPRPFHPSHSKGDLLQRVQQDDETTKAQERDEKESLRLLYVTWTRARDRLVLAAGEGKLTSGILSLLGGEITESELPEHSEAAVGTIWAGHSFELMVRRLSPLEAQPPTTEPGEGYVAARSQKHEPAWIKPSEIKGTGQVGKPEIFGDQFLPKGRPSKEDLGHAVHGLMAADRENLSSQERLTLAREILKRWNIEKALDPGKLAAAANAFRDWAGKQWPEARWLREVPVMHRLDSGSVVRGTCDLALETEEGWVVIDHKSFSGNREEAADKASGYASQLYAYANAIEAATGKPVLGCYIHMPLMGMVLEVTR